MNIPLTREEKLRMMEALWRDLSADETDFASPAWHGDALKKAEAAYANGSAQMIDWSVAKEMLRQRAKA